MIGDNEEGKKKDQSEDDPIDYYKQQIMEHNYKFDIISFLLPVITLASGNSHLLILTKYFKVYSMGKGIGGPLGHSDEISLEKPKLIEALSHVKVTKIAACGFQSGCLTDKKMLLFWGNNGYDSPQLKPSLHIKSLIKDENSKIRDIKLGENHTIVLTESNNVMTWGRNDQGCLGRMNVEKGWFDRDSDDFILTKMEGISAGKFSGVAWDSQNIYYWGNSLGEFDRRNTPFAIPFNSGIKQIEVGNGHLMVLTKAGFIYVLGENKLGQLGVPIENCKQLRLFTMENSESEDEKTKKNGWRLKKSSKTSTNEINKSQSPLKLEQSIIKKSVKDKELKKNFCWSYIYVNGNTSFATNADGDTFIWGEVLKNEIQKQPLHLKSLNSAKTSSMTYFDFTFTHIVNIETPENIRFSDLFPKQVGAGTFEALIDYFIGGGDKDFIETFLITFRSFCTYGQLFDRLQRILETAIKTKDEIVPQNLSYILRTWLKMRKSIYDEFNDYELFQKTNDLISKLSTSSHLKELLTADIESFPKPPAVITVNKTELSKQFSTMKPETIAEQLCLIDHYLFSSISIREFEDQNWSSSEVEVKAPNILRITQRFNTLSTFIIYTIISSENTKERSAKFAKFHSIMEDLFHKNNFYSSRCIHSALESVPIFNLRNSGLIVLKDRSEQKLKEISELFKKNSATYRNHVKNCYDSNLPCIPFLGVHLQDITFMDDGNKDTLENDMINFKKRSNWASIMKMIQKFQELKYLYDRNDEFFQQLYYVTGFSESQLDTIVQNIKKGSSIDTIEDTSSGGVHISNQVKTLKTKRFTLLKLQEQSNIGGRKRIEVWKRWIEDFQSQVKDISVDDKSTFLSFAEVFFQSKAMPLLINKIIQEFPKDQEEQPVFRELMKIVCGLEDENSLDHLIRFLKTCSRFKDTLTVKDKVKVCFIVTSFTSKHKLFDQEEIVDPVELEIEKVDDSVQEMIRVFTSLQYLISEEREQLVKNFNILIHQNNQGSSINDVFQSLKTFLNDSKENSIKEVRELELSKKNSKDDKMNHFKDYESQLEKIKEEEQEVKSQIKELTLKLQSIKERKATIENYLKDNTEISEQDILKPIELKINKILPNIDDDTISLKSLFTFVADIYQPTMDFMSKKICPETKKGTLKEWLVNNLKSMIFYLRKNLAQTTEQLNRSVLIETNKILILITKSNHILMMGRYIEASNESLKELVTLFEISVKNLKDAFRKYKAKNYSSSDILLNNENKIKDVLLQNIGEDDEFSQITDLDFNEKESDQDVSVDDMSGSISPSSPLTKSFLKISSEQSIDNSGTSPRFSPTLVSQSVGIPTSPMSGRKIAWKPPLHIPESEIVLNKSITKVERTCLNELKENVLLDDDVLLRILRKVKFKVNEAVKLANNYKNWYSSKNVEPMLIKPMNFENITLYQLLCLTNTRDLSGRFILYFRWNEYLPQKIDLSEFTLALMFCFEKLVTNPHTQIFGFTLLIDMKDFQWDNFSKEHTQALFKMLQNVSPVKVHDYIFVDPPIWFNTITSMISEFLPKDLITRFTMTARNKIGELINKKDLPFSMGGDVPFCHPSLSEKTSRPSSTLNLNPIDFN